MNEPSDARARDAEAPYRRRFVRVTVDFPVSYSREGGDESKAGRSADLGGGGLRVSTDEDVANACLFLASDVSRQITGVDLPVDGGWAML